MSDSGQLIGSLICVYTYVAPMHACMRKLCHKWCVQDSVLQYTCLHETLLCGLVTPPPMGVHQALISRPFSPSHVGLPDVFDC